MGQHGNIGRAVAQRGHFDVQNLQTIQQVFAKVPIGGESIQALIRCNDKSDIDRPALRLPDASYFTFLNDTQQLCLQCGRRI